MEKCKCSNSYHNLNGFSFQILLPVTQDGRNGITIYVYLSSRGSLTYDDIENL